MMRDHHRKTFVRASLFFAAAALMISAPDRAFGQLPDTRIGEVVPRDVREMYDRGLQFLVSTQSPEGDWRDGQAGPGVTGLCLMAMLASGEDPNFGIYSGPIHKAVRNIISRQDSNTGFYGDSMYHHGFALLALSEAYGAVDDRALWEGAKTARQRTIGQSLELGVRLALTSQKKNSTGGWRYSPDATDADTSVSGAVFVGLLAARNAGIEVPDDCINRVVAYYQSMTSSGGQVGYSGVGGSGDSLARSSIAGVCFALARRKDLAQYSAVQKYLTQQLEQASPSAYPEYTRYYQSQALFQSDVEAWEKWNRQVIREFKQSQQNDGGFTGQYGRSFATSMSLLALALNYRFLPIYER
jgi:hypothetical protein